MTLKNPNMPTECDDRTKQDFECLMADQFSGDVYLVQKNHYHSDVSLYKFTPTRDSETIMLREVGKISSSPAIQSGGYGNTGCRVFEWGVQNWKYFCLKINIPKGNY